MLRPAYGRPYHLHDLVRRAVDAYIGDLTHHPVLLMQKPLTEFAFDTDPKQSAQTRVKLLTMMAEKRIPIVAYHFACRAWACGEGW